MAQAIKIRTGRVDGMIADDYTFANLEEGWHSGPTARYLGPEETGERGPHRIDARFIGGNSLRVSAAVIMANAGNCGASSADSIVSNPMVSPLTLRGQPREGGIVITASHNPARYTGSRSKGLSAVAGASRR